MTDFALGGGHFNPGVNITSIENVHLVLALISKSDKNDLFLL